MPKEQKYIIGVSGGPDSMFCLDKIRENKKKLVVAHVNYQKRSDSYLDEKIVKKYCEKYSLVCEIYHVEKKKQWKGNFQELARKTRYNFFQKLAQKHKAKKIIIAHHLDDYFETFLLQKKRKSLVKYWGIYPETKWGEFWIIRPFLTYTKSQILSYLQENKIAYAKDYTNELTFYQRNLARRELDKLSFFERIALAELIARKNQRLKTLKLTLKKEIKKRLINPSSLELEEKIIFGNRELCLRILYEWLNRSTEGFFYQKKKRVLLELFRQLKESKKKNLIFDLGEGWKIARNQNLKKSLLHLKRSK